MAALVTGIDDAGECGRSPPQLKSYTKFGALTAARCRDRREREHAWKATQNSVR